jgi:hypothetical protein
MKRLKQHWYFWKMFLWVTLNHFLFQHRLNAKLFCYFFHSHSLWWLVFSLTLVSNFIIHSHYLFLSLAVSYVYFVSFSLSLSHTHSHTLLISLLAFSTYFYLFPSTLHFIYISFTLVLLNPFLSFCLTLYLFFWLDQSKAFT